jgi:hypothetical protein
VPRSLTFGLFPLGLAGSPAGVASGAPEGARHICRGPTSGLVMMGAWLFINNQVGVPMTEPSLAELEAERDLLYAQLAAVGDFRGGSVSENWRRCGKPNCACARPGHPGHGPRFLWTRTARGRGTVGRQLAAGEVEKVRREVARHAEFASISEQIAEVNEKICEGRSVAAAGAPSGTEGEKGGSSAHSRETGPPR